VGATTQTASVETRATDSATGAETLAALFPAAARKHAEKRAVIYKDREGQWESKTYTEVE
jgi:acyl-CoA synthetase (AMP-forming)/AMP-acid ligase II